MLHNFQALKLFYLCENLINKSCAIIVIMYTAGCLAFTGWLYDMLLCLPLNCPVPALAENGHHTFHTDCEGSHMQLQHLVHFLMPSLIVLASISIIL